MKIQIQRVGHSPGYTAHAIDARPMEATFKGGLRPGRELDLQFSRIGDGEWHTTKIVRVEYLEDGSTLVHTKNSIYHVVKGWKI